MTGSTSACGSENTWASVSPCGAWDGNQGSTWLNTSTRISPRKYTGVE